MIPRRARPARSGSGSLVPTTPIRLIVRTSSNGLKQSADRYEIAYRHHPVRTTSPWRRTERQRDNTTSRHRPSGPSAGSALRRTRRELGRMLRPVGSRTPYCFWSMLVTGFRYRAGHDYRTRALRQGGFEPARSPVQQRLLLPPRRTTRSRPGPRPLRRLGPVYSRGSRSPPRHRFNSRCVEQRGFLGSVGVNYSTALERLERALPCSPGYTCHAKFGEWRRAVTTSLKGTNLTTRSHITLRRPHQALDLRGGARTAEVRACSDPLGAAYAGVRRRSLALTWHDTRPGHRILWPCPAALKAEHPSRKA